VADEHPSGLGTKIDVVLRRNGSEFWYCEIKIACSPRACLRETLGQVMEYAYWPRAQEPLRLIVCGESALDADGNAYLRYLNERFRLPVTYEQIVLQPRAIAMFDDLITHRAPPPNRVGMCDGGQEQHLPEGAVMVAFAMHLLHTTGLRQVSIHPDGEHGKRFDFRGWLGRQGFTMKMPLGTTSYGGTYAASDGKTIVVNPSSGRGDVVAEGGGFSIVAECKGGIINTRHAGQLSRLRQGLCETIGLSLASPVIEGRRQFAVVPRTKVTETLAARMARRARAAGIDIALVDGRGNVLDVAVTD
jgi:hypothetical protein